MLTISYTYNGIVGVRGSNPLGSTIRNSRRLTDLVHPGLSYDPLQKGVLALYPDLQRAHSWSLRH